MPTVVDFAIDGRPTPATLLRGKSRVIGFAAVDEHGVARVVTSDLASELARIPERAYLDSVLGISAEFALDAPGASRYDDVRALHHVLGEKLPRELKQPPARGNPYDVCRRRAELTQTHFLALRQRPTQGPATAYHDLEMPAVMAVVATMWNGLHVDHEYLSRLREDLQQQLAEARSGLEEAAGKEVNLRDRDVRQYLFEDLGLPVHSRTATDKPVIDDVALERLAADHEVPRRILACRRLQRLVTQAGQIANRIGADRRLHPNLATFGVVTERFTCEDPSLHRFPSRLRDAIVSSPGNVLFEVDVAQAELRVLAHQCHVSELRTAFAQGADVHRATAASVFGKPMDEVADDEREAAKRLTYHVLDGGDLEGLTDGLPISAGQASERLERCRAAYRGLTDSLDGSLYLEVLGDLTAVTIWGRQRRLPAVRSDKQEDLFRASRRANKLIVRGAAAELVKWVVVRLFATLPSDALLVMIDGDRILLNMPESRVEEAAELARASLDRVPAELAVPLVAQFRVGRRWGSLTEWSPGTIRDSKYQEQCS